MVLSLAWGKGALQEPGGAEEVARPQPQLLPTLPLMPGGSSSLFRGNRPKSLKLPRGRGRAGGELSSVLGVPSSAFYMLPAPTAASSP